MTAPLVRSVAALALCLAAAAPAAPAPTSGLYGGLLVAVNGAHVSGAFSEQRQGNGSETAPQFTCEFLFHGRILLGTSTAQLITASDDGDEAISGRIEFGPNAIKLRLNSEPDGCGMTSGDLVDHPYEATHDVSGAGWIGAALIKAPRAPLRRTPTAAPPAKPYLVRGDAVAILSRQGGWVDVAFVSGSKPVKGWIPMNAVEDADAKPR